MGCPAISSAAADSSIVLFLSRDVKTTKSSEYLPAIFTSLNVSNLRFQKIVMLWLWRHHGIALWRRVGDRRHNVLFITKASNNNCWVDAANHVARLWQAGDREISNAGSRPSYGPYHGISRVYHGPYSYGPYHGIKLPLRGIKTVVEYSIAYEEYYVVHIMI